MQLATILRGFAMLGVGALLVACETTTGVKEGVEPLPSDGASTAESAVASSAPQGVPGSSGFEGSPLDDPSSLLSNRVVYFAYDSSEIDESDRPVIEAHGRYLGNNPGAAVTLEGHADERGSREYNIALGERRANAVRQLMSLLGASGSQIRVVSYGEERPAVEGHEESAWSQNRRVEIVYRSR